MKKAELNHFLPYEADYFLLKKCRLWEKWGIGTIGVCSVILPLLKVNLSVEVIKSIYIILNFFYFVLIVGYYVLDIYTETFLYPATARKRRKGLIDNSLGSKFLDREVKDYYSNDNLNYGPYKMIINCCENCYFTLNIAKGMIPQVVIKNGALFIGFLAIAYLGIKDSLIAIPILQILLSAIFLTELIHHINFITKLEQLFERFIDTITKDMDNNQILQQAVLLLLDYETTLAYNKAPLSDKVYVKLKEKLTEGWEDIKKRYVISKKNVYC